MSIAALLLSPALAATIPPGEAIDDAVAVQITEEGLNGVAELIPALLPGEIEIPDQESWDTDWFGWCDYGYGFTDGWVSLSLKDAKITPGNGTLDVYIEMGVQINDAGSKFGLAAEAACIFDLDCPGYVTEFPVYVNTNMALNVVDGQLDATMGELDVSYDLSGDNIQLDCGLQTFEELLGYLGLSIYDFILGFVDGLIQDEIANLGAELETTIEETFADLSISEEFEVNGAILSVDLAPSDVVITPDGLSLVMSGLMDADPSDCVEAWDPGGSLLTQSDIPTVGGSSGAVIALSDELANQALYALWRGGLLCVDLGDIDIGLPLDTSILSLLVGDAFDDLFPEAAPIELVTNPRAAPEVVYDGADDVGVLIEELGIDIFAEVDDRMTRVVGLDLTVDAGVNLDFDSSTGALGIDLGLSGDDISATVSANELAPGTDEDIIAGFSGVFESLVGPLIDGLVGDSLAFDVPGFDGIGLTSLDVGPGGDGDWLMAEAGLGTVSYESSGCGSDGTTDGTDGGCSGGCAAGRVSPKWSLVFTLLGALVLRRRR